MTIDSSDTLLAEAGRPDDDAPNQQVEDAGEHGGGKRRKQRAISKEPRAMREVDDAEAVEKLDDRVARERDEAPEHERVREAGRRALANRAPLQQRRRR